MRKFEFAIVLMPPTPLSGAPMILTTNHLLNSLWVVATCDILIIVLKLDFTLNIRPSLTLL
jgi:hypothetical protein